MTRWTSLLLVLALLLSMLPAMSATVQAATPNYFIPDDSALASKANPANPETLTRADAYVANGKTMSIKGTFQYVSADSLTIRVEQMKYEKSKWVPDPQRFFNSTVNAVSSNRFEISSLELFSGFNKVTITGKQGSTERSDTFYVIYDDVPYLQSLKVRADQNASIPLNEGTSIVLEKPATQDPNYVMQIYLDGVANNTSQVTVNGSKANVMEDGAFFVPPISVKPGKNEIQLVLQNGSNTITVNRTIYYYDPSEPFYSLEIMHGSDGSQKLLGNIPTLTDPQTTASLKVGMILPYHATPFDSSIPVSVFDPNQPGNNPSPVGINGAVKTIDIPSEDGTTNKYKLVEFQTHAYNLTTTGLPETGRQSVTLSLDYNGVTYTGTKSFNYLSGQVLIKSLSLVEKNGSSYLVTRDLNNSEVLNSSYYIQVETNKDFDPAVSKLIGEILPAGSLEVSFVEKIGTNKYIYQITNFPSGEQKLRFHIEGSNAFVQATVNYVSKNYIYVENLYDGQTITIDSRETNRAISNIKGKLVGFDAKPFAEYSINGKTTTLAINDDFSFYLPTLYVDNQPGSLNYGENRLQFRVRYTDNEGTISRDVVKEIRLYIVDVNASTVENFTPVIIPSGGRAPVDGTTWNDSSKVFIDSPLIQFKNNKFTTSEKKIDLAVKAGGANYVKITQAGTTLFEFKTIGDGVTNPYDDSIPSYSYLSSGQPSDPFLGYVVSNPSNVAYDYYGKARNFVIRIKDIDISKTGSYPFMIELKNKVGATITQRIEVVREVSDYRILAPQPTVGNRIVVNKNFVRFDIEAEGATGVTIGGEKAEKRPDFNDRFVYEYVGLKPQKDNAIKVTINRPSGDLQATVNVFYANSTEVGAQYMEKLGTKHSMFDKGLELTFPKGTMLKRAYPSMNGGVQQYYSDTKLLFGLADPGDGAVERQNDYGNLLGYQTDQRTDARTGQRIIPIEPRLSIPFTSQLNRERFTPISQVYWIHGGVGELGTKNTGYFKPATNGLNPYSVEGTFTQFEPTRKLVPTNRGELKIKYNESVVTDAGTVVTVFHFNDQGQWVNIGGEVDTKNNTIKVPFDDFGYYMVAKLRYGFDDVTNHPWARNVLEALFAKGIMPNLRTEDFGTDDYTTRGEFATLLVKSMNIPLNYEGKNTFFDVRPEDQAGVTWNYKYIETAARAGIVTGLDNGYFGAKERLSREQAAAMISRALNLKTSVNDAKLLASLTKAFTDAEDIQYYALPLVEAVYKKGIMVGLDNPPKEGQKKPTFRFEPKSPLTRAQAGQIAVRLLQDSTKIFPSNLN